MSILQEIEDFLIVLRDNYGFLIPVDRLKLCLSCVTDITDVEEVLFRLQSLVCRNELQIDIFRSLFAQRFLGIHPKAGESGGEPKEKGRDRTIRYPRRIRSSSPGGLTSWSSW